MIKSITAGPPYRGSCLCGVVGYEFKALSEKIGHCHCSMCRKFHGAAFASLAEVSRTDFHWTRGESELRSYLADNGTLRRFCNNCGASMSFEMASHPERIEIALGTLDTDIPYQPDVHIFTDFKSSWYTIEDKLPQFKQPRNGARQITAKPDTDT